MRLQTRTIHTGVDKDTAYNSIMTPIYQTSTFRFADIGVTRGYDYTRTSNPTRKALEENIASLEGGAGAIAVATGMAAITTVLHLFQSGDHIICTHDCYGGTDRILRLYQDQFNVQVSHVNLQNTENLQAAFRPNTKAVWIETPSNPLLNILDIRELSRIAHEHGALSIVDNTFLSPVNQRPFELDADIIVHSTTKYLNGHSDVVGGAVVAKEAKRCRASAVSLQCTRTGGLAIRLLAGAARDKNAGAPHAASRTECHRALLGFLPGIPPSSASIIPGLETHPHHDVARRQQQSGFGGMVSFESRWKAGSKSHHVLRSVKIFALAESLGGVESLIDHPMSMTHASMDPQLREEAGITENLIRLSVGLESIEDILDDLGNALDTIPKPAGKI